MVKVTGLEDMLPRVELQSECQCCVCVSWFVYVALYECLTQYKMDRVPRGRCVIINIATFDMAPEPLLSRCGSDKDAG